jgi:hypothetical protein
MAKRVAKINNKLLDRVLADIAIEAVRHFPPPFLESSKEKPGVNEDLC